jgi:SET domain-containing protein
MKKSLLFNLNNETFCRLRPDKHGGVGVFAIKTIPKGVNPIKTPKGLLSQRIINIPDEEVQKMDPNVAKMIKDFYVQIDGKWGIPYLGLNSIDISFYLNHSDKPNMKIVEDDKCTMLCFESNRVIHEGEELSINYSEYDE